MGKLHFKYGTMNSGKTFEILRTAHNYEENGYKVIIIKPSVDLKGEKSIVSRVGMKRDVDYLITPSMKISSIYDGSAQVILADEAQFFTKKQIDDLWLLTKNKDVTVFCFGLKTDFLSNSFPGSRRLFELADKIEEVTTLCKCGNKAMFNLRMLNGNPIFDGDQISIDGFGDVTYAPVCGLCYIKKFEIAKKNNKTNKKELFEQEEMNV